MCKIDTGGLGVCGVVEKQIEEGNYCHGNNSLVYGVLDYASVRADSGIGDIL